MDTFFILWLLCSYFQCVYAIVMVKHISSDKPVATFDDKEARFGKRLHDIEPIIGFAHASDPLEGCVRVISLPHNASKYAFPFVCLIKRGNCSFEDKVRSAFMGGFAAALVYNNESDHIFPMAPSRHFQVPIPSVMIGLSDGDSILHNYTDPIGKFILEIYADDDWEVQIYIIPVLCIFGLFVLGLGTICLCRCHEQRRRRQQRCLTAKQIHTLPQYKYHRRNSNTSTCVICLEEFEEGLDVRKLPCDHVYHSKCIDPWLLRGRRVCPICKRNVFPSSSGSRSIFNRFRSSNSSFSSDNAELENQLLIDTDVVTERPLSSLENLLPSSYGTVVEPAMIHRHRSTVSLAEYTPLLQSEKHNQLGSTKRNSLPRIKLFPNVNSNVQLMGTFDSRTNPAHNSATAQYHPTRKRSTAQPSQSPDSPSSQSTSISSHRSEPNITLSDPSTNSRANPTDASHVDRVEVMVHQCGSPDVVAHSPEVI